MRREIVVMGAIAGAACWAFGGLAARKFGAEGGDGD